jgi:hypothetical protein
MVYQLQNLRRFAAMGGAYGNFPALKACLQDAKNQQCEALAFLGDSIGHGCDWVKAYSGLFQASYA